MSDSMWKSYLDPQIEARNRWAVHRSAYPEDRPARARAALAAAPPVRTRIRRRVVAAAALVGASLLALFVVLALQLSSPDRHQVLAPAAPTVGQLPATTVYGDALPAAPGHALAR